MSENIEDKPTTPRDNVKYSDENQKSQYLLHEENMSPDKTTVFNIRKNQKGLYFDLRIYGKDKDKTIKNLLIPKQFYTNGIEETVEEDKRKKVLMFQYVLIYCAAVLSIIIIINGIMRVIPLIKRYFGF